MVTNSQSASLLHFCPISCQSFTSGIKVLLSNKNPPLSFFSFYFFFSLSFCFSPFLKYLSLFISFFPALSLTFSLPLLVLYRKTFLVFCSTPAKPGAYFQCPKLIANVRTDPSSPSLFPPFIPPTAPTSSSFGINS